MATNILSQSTSDKSDATIDNKLNNLDKNAENNESDSNSKYKMVFTGILILVLIALLYYSYNRFVTNKITEPMTKGVEQERDDPVIDFNLREAIKELQNIQKNVLSTLSEASDL